MIAMSEKGDRIITAAVTAAIVGVPVLWKWRKLRAQCVEREFAYRRLFGKWRWEH